MNIEEFYTLKEKYTLSPKVSEIFQIIGSLLKCSKNPNEEDKKRKAELEEKLKKLLKGLSSEDRKIVSDYINYYDDLPSYKCGDDFTENMGCISALIDEELKSINLSYEK